MIGLTTLKLLFFNQVFAQEASSFVIVLDAGHGGKDPGAHGKEGIEKEVVLDVSLKLDSLLKVFLPSAKIIHTRKDDTFVPLRERAKIANEENADLFMSIHCNSAPKGSRTARGSETFVLGLRGDIYEDYIAELENSVIEQESNYEETYEKWQSSSPEAQIMMANYFSVHLEESMNAARLIQEELGYYDGKYNRGVKQAHFLVLAQTTVPSVLVELGFLSNTIDEQKLMSEKGRIQLATSLCYAIIRYKAHKEMHEG
ncbi:N-acetylmuramoyl-L-alanine amidase family protein [Sediminitomix flava]|nr:N-acetylmuramoyl-L-alanine amidase [Sediminitomix flava]